MDYEKLKEERLEANRELARLITDAVEKNTDLRFGQLLIVMGVLKLKKLDEDDNLVVVDPFNEEPMTTLERVKKETEKFL